MYQCKSRLTARKQSRPIEHFVAGTTACGVAAELLKFQLNTVIRFFMRLRQLTASKQPSYELSEEIEADESYFNGKDYTAIIPNKKTEDH
jgi:transposase